MITSKKNYIISVAILLFLTNLAWADEQAATRTSTGAFPQPTETANLCLSGKKENQQLIQSLEEAKKKSPISQEIIKPYVNSTEGTHCVDCETKPNTAPNTEASKIVAAITNASTNPLPQENSLLFKTECLSAMVPFQSSVAQYSCDKEGRPNKVNNLCVDSSVLNYQNQTMSNLVRCLMASQTPGAANILPTTLLNIYSIETGFKPQYSSTNGVGLGQLTGIFIKDVQTRGQKWTNKILEYSKNNTSTSNACSAAKAIIEDKKKPSRNQICDFMSIGSGMERNMLYSLLGLTVVLEKSIDPLISSYKNFAKLSEDDKEKLRQITLTESYGHGGPSAARALIRRISRLPSEKIIDALNTEQLLVSTDKEGNRKLLNSYLTRIKKRQKNMVKMNYLPADSELAKNFSKEGSRACLSVTK